MNQVSILILWWSTSFNRLYCINLPLCFFSLSCRLFVLCLKVYEQWAIHHRYRKSPDYVAEMCHLESLKLVFGDRTNPHVGALLVRAQRTISHGIPLGDRPNTFQGSTCRASPINSPSHHLQSRRVAVGRVQRILKQALGCVLVGRLSILSAFVYTETTTKSWTVSEAGPDTTPVRASKSSVLCWSVSTVLFVSHRSFTATMLHLLYRRFLSGRRFL